MVKYKKGDLLEASEDIIAHGVNCVGGFGSGVAGQIAIKWPSVRKAYLSYHNETGWSLGGVQKCLLPNSNKIVANCSTQKECFPRGVCHADYDAIKSCMNILKDWGQKTNKSIAIPKIGCGLAGGDWEIVKAILEDVFQDYDVTVYEL